MLGNFTQFFFGRLKEVTNGFWINFYIQIQLIQLWFFEAILPSISDNNH